MDEKMLKRLRPRDGSAAALNTALDAVRHEFAAATSRLAEMNAVRGRMLLTSTSKEVLAHDESINTARLALEQLTAMAQVIEVDLRNAAVAERTALLEAKAEQARDDALALAERFSVWWHEEYPSLARKLLAGIQLEQQAVAACTAAVQAHRTVPREYASEVALPSLPGPLWQIPGHGRVTVRLWRMVQLPAPEGGGEPIWWPGELLGRGEPDYRVYAT